MTKTITLPKLTDGYDFKDYLVALVEALSDATGYDFEFLDDILCEMMDNMDIYETFGEMLNSFIATTLEMDW